MPKIPVVELKEETCNICNREPVSYNNKCEGCQDSKSYNPEPNE